MYFITHAYPYLCVVSLSILFKVTQKEKCYRFLETFEQTNCCESNAEGAIRPKWNPIVRVRIEPQWRDIQYSLRVLPDNQSNMRPAVREPRRADRVLRRARGDWEPWHKSSRRTLQLPLGREVHWDFCHSCFWEPVIGCVCVIILFTLGFSKRVSLDEESLAACKHLYCCFMSNLPHLLQWN